MLQKKNQQEQRQFFRFDVSVPVYLKPIAEDYSSSVSTQPLYLSEHSEPSDSQLMSQVNSQLSSLFKEEKYIQNGGVQLFEGLSQKLDFMIWLFDSMMQGSDPRGSDDFVSKWLQVQKSTLPQGGNASPFIALLQAFYIRVDEMTAELLSVLDKKRQTKLLLLDEQSRPNFDGEHYLHNLLTLAHQGNWLAKVTELMISKLNSYEDTLRATKESIQSLVNSQNWPIESVNLAAGGFALYSEADIQVGDQVCSLFLLDEQMVLGKSKCVAMDPSSPTEDLARFSFKFESISSEDEAHIVRFLTSKELENRAA